VNYVKNGKIGVVITAYKETAAQVLKAIDSVRGQDHFGENFEIVVAFDRDAADTWFLEGLLEGNKVRAFYKSHSGVAATRNFGVEKLGDVEYIWCLDADTFLLFDDVLSKFVKALETAPERDYAYGRILIERGESQYLAVSRPFSELALGQQMFIPFAALIRADKWVGQDESFPVLVDYEMWLEMYERNGSRGVLVPMVVLANRIDEHSLSDVSVVSREEREKALEGIKEKHKKICPRIKNPLPDHES